MSRLVSFLFVLLVGAVWGMPVEKDSGDSSLSAPGHSLQKRFINPSLTVGDFADGAVSKMRTKRDAEECEKLELCRLHARSRSNFFAAFQLYFVNRENAKLWDHQSRSAADCNDRFSCYDR